MDTLHELIGRNRGVLIARWKERVRGSLDPTHADTYELENSVPAFLDEITDEMARSAASQEKGRVFNSRLAEEHGRQRFSAGMNLASTILEYGVLEGCILDLVAEQPDQHITMTEFRTLAELLNVAIADASREFMRRRDAEIQRQAAEHLAFLAHEIRGPLGSIALSFELLSRTTRPADDRVAGRIARDLEQLQRTIDESILAVEIKDLGVGHALRLERLNLQGLITDVVEECSIDASARSVALTADDAGDLAVDGDRRLLRSVLSNLVRNAIKFTRPNGRIRIYATCANGRVCIEVEDQCGGLPPGKTEELFLPFRQRSPDRRGFGLGLAIVKQAVEAHSGSLQVRNLPGHGCVFMVDLPAPAQ
jgi:signal transduction histidine kinase